MAIKDVRKTLKDENELLEGMIKFVDQFPSSRFSSQAIFIKKSWQGFLKDRYDTNNAQQKLMPDDLKKDFLSEICQIGAYVHVSADRPGYSERWVKFLKCEAEISGYLHNQI